MQCSIKSIDVQVASKCRGARRKLPSAAASRHKVSTVKPTTNNMTQRERDTAPSKFNSRFIRRFGVCVRSSGLQCRRQLNECDGGGGTDGVQGNRMSHGLSPQFADSVLIFNTTPEKASETRTVPKEVRVVGFWSQSQCHCHSHARGGQLLASPFFVFCTDSLFVN